MKLPADVRAARRWPRAAVWGGALASTAMNLSANWHATTTAGVTSFVAPTANGLHLPEVTKLVVSAAFPLLLIFAVESAARTSLRFAWKDLGSYAMPVGALTVFAFSVGEVSTLMLGMGMALPLALLFSLAPDILITAGTVVLMRERVRLAQEAPLLLGFEHGAPVLPAPSREAPAPVAVKRVPAAPLPAGPPALPQEAPATLPPPPAEPPARGEQEREAPSREAGGVVPIGTIRSEEEVLAAIREYQREHSRLPTPNWLKVNLRIGPARAANLLAEASRDGREATG